MNFHKPILKKGYGSIPHLPGSRLGEGDHHINQAQARILTEKVRDKHDRIIVQEKLDGSCVGVLKKEGILIPIMRSGWACINSKYYHQVMFHNWVMEHQDHFYFLNEGERVMGEWMAMVHTLHYDLSSFDGAFFAFDLFNDQNERVLYEEFNLRTQDTLNRPIALSLGDPLSIEEAMSILDKDQTVRCVEGSEGAVWRVERKGKVEFLAKYVRHDMISGKNFIDQKEEWNWRSKINE